nr:hypothetical protein 11 [Legionellales bacterium]
MKLRKILEAGYTSQEAQDASRKAVADMVKNLRKTEHDLIKSMNDGVKSGNFDPLDLQRSIQFGDVRVAHPHERDFLDALWLRAREGFRRYMPKRRLRVPTGRRHY